MTGRSNRFWSDLQFAAGMLPTGDLSKADLSMGCKLDDEVEKRSCCKLTLIGPLLDGYTAQIGSAFKNKLSRSKATGIQQSSVLFYPYPVFIQFVKLVKGYGGNFKIIKDRMGNVKEMILLIDTQSTAKQVWHPARTGSNYLSKRMFKKLASVDGKRESVYDGHARVVVTVATPIKICYRTKNETCITQFYIQRYNHLDQSTDVRLQCLLNGEL